MANYHVKMTNSPTEKVTLEEITKKTNQKVHLSVSKNVLALMKKRAGVVGKASPNAIVKAYITTTLNLD